MKKKKGGVRAGAGRPKGREPKVMLRLRLTQDAANRMFTQGVLRGARLSEYLESFAQRLPPAAYVYTADASIENPTPITGAPPSLAVVTAAWKQSEVERLRAAIVSVVPPGTRFELRVLDPREPEPPKTQIEDV